jgi:hypothetical protein
MCSCVLRRRGIRSNVITALEKRQENQLAAQLDQLRELKLEIAALSSLRQPEKSLVASRRAA